jgi:hypothetical protein
MLHFAGESVEPPAFRGRCFRGLMTMLTGIFALFMWAGCTSPARPVRPVEVVARVVVENHTDFAWRVSLVSVDAEGTPPRWQAVAPRETLKLAFNPGVYRVRREITGDGDAGEPRSTPDSGIDLTLIGGRTYTWPLATLFSKDEVER